jgi:hypothetical protein
MPAADPSLPSYLIVTDHDRDFFAVEGPMTDDRPWNEAAAFARNVGWWPPACRQGRAR